MVTLGELLNEPVEERDDRLEDKWWQYDVDEWDGVVYDGEGNIAFVRDEHGNWLPFPNQEVAANSVNVNNQEGVENVINQEGENVNDQEVVENVNNQAVNNVQNQEGENVNDQEVVENVINQEDVENVNNQAVNNVGDQGDVILLDGDWWQDEFDKWDGILFEYADKNITLGNWLQFSDEEEVENVNDQAINNVQNQEGENVNDQEDVENVNDLEDVDNVINQEDVENVNNQAVNNVGDQELENVDDQEDVENVNDKEEEDQEVENVDDEVGGGTKSGEDEGGKGADEHDSGKGLVGNPGEGLGVSGNNSMAGTKRVMGTDDEVGGGTKSGEDDGGNGAYEYDSGKGLAGNPDEGLGVFGNNSMAGTKRVLSTDDEVGGGTKSGEDEGGKGADEHDSGKGLVGNSGKGLGVSWGNKRHIMTAAVEREHQDGLKRVKTASATDVDDQEDENQENPKLDSKEDDDNTFGSNGGDDTKGETSSELSIKTKRVEYDEDEEVKSDKTGNKRRFMTEEEDEHQEGSKRAKKEKSPDTPSHDGFAGSVKDMFGRYVTKVRNWWCRN